MGKYRVQTLNKKKKTRWEREGRGQGTGENYRPALKVREVPSMGRSTRTNSPKLGRHLVLLSDIERNFALLLNWSDLVVDIREQFPLPLEETLDISESLGIKHPSDDKKGQAKQMTSDFYITFTDNSELVVSVKPYNELSKKRTIEKLEIERYFWEKKGIPWRIVTEKDIPKAFVDNVVWTRKAEDLSFYRIDSTLSQQIRKRLEQLVLNIDMPLNKLTSYIDDELGAEPGDSLVIVRHLIATKQWTVNMFQKINPHERIQVESIKGTKQEREKVNNIG